MDVASTTTSLEASPTATHRPLPSKHTARIGLLLVAVILASCFGVLVATSRGDTASQTVSQSASLQAH